MTSFEQHQVWSGHHQALLEPVSTLPCYRFGPGQKKKNTHTHSHQTKTKKKKQTFFLNDTGEKRITFNFQFLFLLGHCSNSKNSIVIECSSTMLGQLRENDVGELTLNK